MNAIRQSALTLFFVVMGFSTVQVTANSNALFLLQGEPPFAGLCGEPEPYCDIRITPTGIQYIYIRSQGKLFVYDPQAMFVYDPQANTLDEYDLPSIVRAPTIGLGYDFVLMASQQEVVFFSSPGQYVARYNLTTQQVTTIPAPIGATWIGCSRVVPWRSTPYGYLSALGQDGRIVLCSTSDQGMGIHIYDLATSTIERSLLIGVNLIQYPGFPPWIRLLGGLDGNVYIDGAFRVPTNMPGLDPDIVRGNGIPGQTRIMYIYRYEENRWEYHELTEVQLRSPGSSLDGDSDLVGVEADGSLLYYHRASSGTQLARVSPNFAAVDVISSPTMQEQGELSPGDAFGFVGMTNTGIAFFRTSFASADQLIGVRISDFPVNPDTPKSGSTPPYSPLRPPASYST